MNHLSKLAFLLCLGCLCLTKTPAMTVNLYRPYDPATSGPRSDNPVIFYAPEQTNFMFEHGGQIDIFLQSTKRAMKVDWALSRNYVATPFLTGSCDPGYNESFQISIPTAKLIPAFYDLRVKVQLSAKQSMDAVTVFGWKATQEPLVPVVPRDFETYWRGEKEKIDKTPLDLKVTFDHNMSGPEISAYNVEHAALPEDYDPSGEKYQQIEVYKVDWASPNGQRTYGWFAKPAGKGPFPGLLVLPGAGNNPRPIPAEHARHGFAALDINVHNSPVDLPEDQYPKVAYDKPYTVPDDYWGHHVYVNALQAVSALAQLPGVDPKKLAVMGGSQGGRASVVVASLDPRIKAAVFAIAHFDNIPWLLWTQRLNTAHDAGFRPFTEKEVVHDDAMRVQSYFDVANFAAWIKCPVLMNSGLIDPVSPPTGVFAVYRNLKAAPTKKIIPLPNVAHDWSPAFDRYAWRWLDQELGVPAASATSATGPKTGP